MAIKALMLRKCIDLKQKELAKLAEARADLEKREAEAEKAIEEVENDEQMAAVQETVDALKEERTKLEADEGALTDQIRQLESELEETEKEVEAEPAPQPEPEVREKKKEEKKMIRSNVVMTRRDRLAEMVQRDDVKAYLSEVRAAIKEKRAITNIGLLIPEVFLGMLRENIEEYSKLYKHVNVRRISGTGREVIMGAVPEAIWTDCCANLNELSLAFNDVEVDCYKTSGFFAVCNANLEDSDIDLASELLVALGQAIGLSLDKAILYGRNSNTTQKMPQGIVSRLVQTAAPTGYPATARAWADLHTSNIISLTAGLTGAALFAALVIAAGAAKNKYGRGVKTWVMNETTHTKLLAAAVTINAAGAIVSGMGNTMPVLGGDIEILDFVPDNVIIGGYFDLYLLAERAGAKFATSEHVRFLQDQTVFKGTARYDGVPVIAEGFVAIGLEATTPTAAMTFPADTAN